MPWQLLDTSVMNPEALLARHFSPLALPLIVHHSRLVADKALKIAVDCGFTERLDLTFIEEGAMLHDIGVSLTDAPSLDCHGMSPYICHGILGRKILEKEGLPRHALVCERHIGVGLTVADIIEQNLPLPKRDMVPLTDEEQIIALADLFFSKKGDEESEEKEIVTIRSDMAKFGAGKVIILDSWLKKFSLCIAGGREV